jgi:hypothetical protein
MTDGNRWPATAALSAVTGGDQRRESTHARAITGGRGQKVLGRLTGGPVSKLTQPNFFQLIKFSSTWKFNLKALPSFKKPKLCMRLDLNILNIFPNWVNFQFPTYIML